MLTANFMLLRPLKTDKMFCGQGAGLRDALTDPLS